MRASATPTVATAWLSAAATLAISLSAYEQWLMEDDQPIEELLDRALTSAVVYFGQIT